MKKLGKFTISPSKVMKNEELVDLKGGIDFIGEGPCNGYCFNGENYLGSFQLPYCHYPVTDLCKNYYPETTWSHCMC